MIFIAGGTLAFFFEFLLLSKKNKSLADKILAVWMLMLGLHLFLVYYSFAGLNLKYTFLLGIGNPFPFLHCPMLFLYTLALTGKINRFRFIYLIHFAPFFFFYFYYASFFTMDSVEKIAFINKFKEGYSDFYSRYSYFGMLVLAITYLVLIFISLLNHKKNIQSFYSYSNDKINLHWLRYLLIGMACVWSVVIVSNLFYKNNRPDYYIYISVVLFVISIGYFGIRQGNIFVAKQPEVIPDKPVEDNYAVENPKRYAKSGLKEVDIQQIQLKLTDLMEKKKLYLDETLSLNKLSEQVEILPNYLSQVINERYGKNFYDFVNSYRVEEFKNIVQRTENRNKTLLALALDSGFTSKASFNNFFKKLSGQTPSEYIKSLKN